jgi:hypothetical protein
MRFFFHLFDRLTWEDEEGEELADIGAARVSAMGRMRRIAAGAAWQGRFNPDHGIRVSDEAGATLFALTFRDALWTPPRRPSNGRGPRRFILRP